LARAFGGWWTSSGDTGRARSTQFVAAIVKAAILILEREGAHRFTTIRVAEAADVSVGSLYQYLPNKRAILNRLQLDEWEKTAEMVDTILAEQALPPRHRLRRLMRAFFRSEREEAPLPPRARCGGHELSQRAERARPPPQQSMAGRRFRFGRRTERRPQRPRFAAQLLFMTMTSLGKQGL